eukprot:TRINITY_DN27113_c0_g1_i1.p1 TRINITY_DN27113_c0_g1~~TRINITY_DN27113_c0_g1_i1.p1  ORF type:complete len:407 (+),score=181.23 TRINITY_DN27113_c0_g1_i1:276-1496(+)
MDDSKKKFVVNTETGFKRTGSASSMSATAMPPRSFNGGEYLRIDGANRVVAPATPPSTMSRAASVPPAAIRTSSESALRRAAHRSIGSLSDLKLEESSARKLEESSAISPPSTPADVPKSADGSPAGTRRRARPASSTLMDLLMQSDKQQLIDGKPEDAEDIRRIWAEGKGQESASLLFLQDAAEEDERRRRAAVAEEETRRREFEQKQEEARAKREQRMAEIRKRQEEEALALKQSQANAEREAEAELARIEELAKRQAAEALEARLQREADAVANNQDANAGDLIEKKDKPERKEKHHKKEKRDGKHGKKQEHHHHKEGTLVSESRKSRAIISQPFRNCLRVELDFSAALRGQIDHFLYSVTLDDGLFAMHSARTPQGGVVAVEFDRITSGVLHAQARTHEAAD